MKDFLARVTIRKIEHVADPEGKTISEALSRLGYDWVKRVRTGRIFFVEFAADDEAHATELIEAISEKILSNPIIENFSFELEEL